MVQSISTPTSGIDSTAGAGDVKAAIAVKMFKEAQVSQQVVGNIIQDTAQISAAAMKACQAERCS